MLSLLYFDYSTIPRRIRKGTIALDDGGEAVIRVKVCRDVLVVECTNERQISPARTNFSASAACYRLQPSGNDEVSAERISVIDTFRFPYIDYSHQILSDHSTKYYAAFSKSSGPFGSVGVWEIETGVQVKRIESAKLVDIGGLMTDLLVVREGVEEKVVMIGNDRRNNNARRWDRFEGQWGYLSNIRIFSINGDNDEEVKGFVGRTKYECPHDSNLLTTTFKVVRPLGALDEDNTDGPEEAALVLWELEDHTDKATAHYHTLSEAAFSRVTNPDEPIRADKRYVLPSAGHMPQGQAAAQRPTPFTVKTKDALSFTMDFTGRNEDFEGTRLMLYHLQIQSFYPSPTDPGVMNLLWESYLKQAKPSNVGKEDDPEKHRPSRENRGIYSSNRNVTYQNYYGMEVVGDERAVVFLELRERGMDLVVAVWDDPFEGAVLKA